MKFNTFSILFILLVILSPVLAFSADFPERTKSLGTHYQVSPHSAGKAQRDTVKLIGPWGSGAQVNGQFEDQSGLPAWNGWTHADPTQPTTSHWHISDYQAEMLGSNPEPGNLAAWCGDPDIPPCSPDDLAGGYGNNWQDIIEWTGQVDNTSLSVNVHLTAYANIDCENGYDFVYIQYKSGTEMVNALTFDGYLPNEFIDVEFSLDPEDYQGAAQNEIVIQIVFKSDGSWSDADCLWPTAGAIQIDDITVTTNQGGADTVSFSDFQDGWGDWNVVFWHGVGDFTKLWQNLGDIDPCSTNYSPQVAFIDDGLVVPGTGPTYCMDWCYGPGGYTVNTTGGLAGPDYHLWNVVMSPVMDWPGDSFNDTAFEVMIYYHELLGVDSPGIFVGWSVRSANTVDDQGNPTGDSIEDASWSSDYSSWYGAASYDNQLWGLGDYLEPGLDQIQIRLECWDGWGVDGNNGTPAPYFDNIRLSAISSYGPIGGASALNLANDNFPAIGEVDLITLGNNSVRFDRAATYQNEGGTLYAGDVIKFRMEPRREGAELAGLPEAHFLVHQNPLFNGFRSNPEFGSANAGIVLADSVRGWDGEVIPGQWFFDLPDSNFLFPGDVIHYFITGTDGGGPNLLPWETITIPSDTSGFNDFTGPRSFNNAFTMRALPSVFEDPLNPGQLKTPKVMFWHDDVRYSIRSDFDDSFAEWFNAFDSLGLVCGRDYDFYYTNGASAGRGNGIGGRATALSLVGYEDFIYTAGRVFTMSLSDGIVDLGNDLGVLDQWLRLGNRDLFMTGDSFISDISTNCGMPGVQFVEDWVKVQYFDTDIRPLINQQTTPRVRPIPGNGVFQDDLTWIAFGGCPLINDFDAMAADEDNGGIRLAEFLNPAGASGYSYSAATLCQDADTGSRVITFPYDFSFIYSDHQGDKVDSPLATRAVVLEQVLGFFGIEGDPLDVSPVPSGPIFAVRNYPNPFNPSTRIEYTLAQPGHLKVKIFNVRGELVKTLIDEVKNTGGFVVWDGKDNQETQVSSGVYFFEARSGGEVKVEKMVLIK